MTRAPVAACGRCRPRTTPWCWPRSPRSATRCSETLARRAAENRPRPTTPTPWSRWPAMVWHQHTAVGKTDQDGPAAVDQRGRRRSSCASITAALMRGHPIEGEVCEVTGVGPVPVPAVRRWIADDAFVAAILTKGVDVRSVVHLGRQATALQRTALEWLAPECCVRGCPNQARLEIDHERDWARTHHTTLDELDHLCAHHHRMKTRHGHRLEPGTGKRRMLPPSTPQTGATARGSAALRGSRLLVATIRLGPPHRRRDPATPDGSPAPDSCATPALLTTPARLTPDVVPGAPCRRPWGRTPADTTTPPHHAAPLGRGRAPPPRTPDSGTRASGTQASGTHRPREREPPEGVR